MNRKQRKLGTADSRMFRSFLEILEQSRPSWINPERSRMFRSILAHSQVGGDGEAIRGGIIVQEGRFWNGLERSGTFSKGGVLRVDRCLLEREESRVSAESAPSQPGSRRSLTCVAHTPDVLPRDPILLREPRVVLQPVVIYDSQFDCGKSGCRLSTLALV